LLSKCNINIENCSFFACFRFLIFHPFFQGAREYNGFRRSRRGIRGTLKIAAELQQQQQQQP